MVKLKVHIRHQLLWKLKNNKKKNATETAKKIFSVCGQGVITNGHNSVCQPNDLCLPLSRNDHDVS